LLKLLFQQKNNAILPKVLKLKNNEIAFDKITTKIYFKMSLNYGLLDLGKFFGISLK